MKEPNDGLESRVTLSTLVLTSLVLVLAAALLSPMGSDGTSQKWKEALAYLLALLFGGAVGAAELVARYRDRPAAALRTQPAAIYIGINSLSSIAAFWLLYTNRLTIEANIFGANHPALNDLVLGGFGAMALFRTAVFNVRVGDTSVAIGPAALLQVILRAADRETDRLRAGPRAARVGEIMRAVVYSRARDPLPLHCFALMQNLTLEEQNDLEQALAVLDKKDGMGDEAKAYSLGLLLMNLVGEDVLLRAVNGLGERIKGPAPDTPAVLSRAKELNSADLLAILETCRALSHVAPAQPNPDADLIAPHSTAMMKSDQVVIALAKLRRRFGPETVAEAIKVIIEARTRESTDQLATSDFQYDTYTARDTTDTIQGAADTARDTTDTIQGAADTARDTTDTIQGAADTARDTTDTIQGAADTARDTTDTIQGAADTARDTTDTIQGAADTARDTTDTIRGAADTARDTTDTIQGAADTARDTTDTTPDNKPRPV